MKSLINLRIKKGLSQRTMAHLASLSFGTIQLLESGRHDPKISTLKNMAQALGYPSEIVERCLNCIFEQPSDSVSMISERIIIEGEASWRIWLFNFVDAFRKEKDRAYIDSPPVRELSDKLNALIASTVETLCEELKIKAPTWCCTIPSLKKPWFVSGVENLKAISIAESPIHFRKRNIFVLENFLSRR
jgi:transcriptional regulator with XRE-family HTH domain